MDGPRDGYTKCSKSDRKRQIQGIVYMWNLKRNGTNELIYKIEIDSQRKRLLRFGHQAQETFFKNKFFLGYKNPSH